MEDGVEGKRESISESEEDEDMLVSTRPLEETDLTRLISLLGQIDVVEESNLGKEASLIQRPSDGRADLRHNKTLATF